MRHLPVIAMNEFDPGNYGPVFSELLATDRCRDLGQGNPDRAIRSRLDNLSVSHAFGKVLIVDLRMAEACLAGIWLLYDYLDDSHTISQNLSGSTGSFWHGIMHRREGDYSNAKYWFRNVGYHPVYDPLGMQAADLATKNDANSAFSSELWNPMAFVDSCQIAVRTGEHQCFCQAVQQAEWELLFDYCYQQAID